MFKNKKCFRFVSQNTKKYWLAQDFSTLLYMLQKTPKKNKLVSQLSVNTLWIEISFSPTASFFLWSAKKIKRESEKKETEQWKQCILSHSHVFCNHLLFPLVTSALAKFMWPLTWPLNPMENHLFEGKDDWHNANSTSIAVFYG